MAELSRLILYLASGSLGRREMLENAKIPFTLLSHKSKEEAVIKRGLETPIEYVQKIANDKLNSVCPPNGPKGKEKKAIVLVGDTLVFTKSGEMLSKPFDKADATRMLTTLNQGPADVISCAVLGKFHWNGSFWTEIERRAISEVCEFLWFIPENEIEFYFKAEPNYMCYSSSATLDGAGAQYIKWIKGSVSTVTGMPMFQVREILAEWGLLDYRN